MKYLQLLLILAFSNILFAQQFVDPSNEWLTDDCCYVVGEFHCSTYKYWFADPVSIDSQIYHEIKTNNSNPDFEFGGFYREDNGRVYMRANENEEEFIIYDFELEVGEQLEIGNADYSFFIEVLSVDSITLNSGERRKRLEVGYASNHDIKTYWVEGIGSELSTMNPLYMFSLDCWNDFNCFHSESFVEYQVGNCQITSSKNIDFVANSISCYPNPATNELVISSINNNKIQRLEILDIRGNRLYQSNTQELAPLNISDYPPGMYFAKVEFANGEIGISKFVKGAY